MVEMPDLRIVPAEFEDLAVLQAEGYPTVGDLEYLGGAAVDQTQPRRRCASSGCGRRL